MSRQENSLEANPPKRSRSARRIFVPIAVLLLVAALLWWGRASLAWWTRLMAGACLNDGAISAAQGWLDWSAWSDPSNGATDLMRATCFRRLDQPDRWSEALKRAEQKGASASQVQLETKLRRIRDGDFDEGIQGELAAMTAAGVSPTDFYAALVNGYVVKKDPERAKIALDAWEADRPDEAHLAYMKGAYWLRMSQGELDIERRQDFVERTRREFETALARQPRHELARIALAEWFEDQSRLEEACDQYAALAASAPANETAKLGLAKLYRELNRLDEARTVLESLPPRFRESVEFAAETAELELESGHYQEADRWFVRARVGNTDQGGIVVAAAVSAAVQEQAPRARELFAWLDAVHDYNVRMDGLLARVATGVNDSQAEDELRRLKASPLGERGPDAEQTAGDRQPDAETTASGLYALHCSGCHGENGDGNGRAARHLFPKPRDLGTGKFRLVSTVNGVPSLEDLEAGIRRGMPGTSMRAFDKLGQDQRMLLAQEVRRLNRVGIGEHFIDTLLKEGERIDENEVRAVVKLGSTPADAAWVPRIGLAVDPQAIARGKDAYFKLGCKNCHGADGMGDWDLPLFDEKGRTSPPRDLVHEAFKGGHEPESIYLRILLGMPGTPHPACPAIADDQRTDLVHFCRSLGREPKREWSNHQRALQAWTIPNRVGG
jgi:mono/diheme cytochrome c family protein/Tfp pilus assembly protein PilF